MSAIPITSGNDPYSFESNMPTNAGYFSTGTVDVGTVDSIDQIRADSENFWNILNSRAEQWRNYAVNQYTQIQELIDNWEDPSSFDASLDDPGLSISDVPFNFSELSFPAVVLPTDPESPAPAEITFPGEPSFSEVPEFSEEAPTLDFSGEPDPLEVTDPGDPPTLEEPDTPDPLELNFPDPPELGTIEVPDAIELSFPEFEGVKPELPEGMEIPPDFEYSEGGYTSAVFDVLSSKIISELEDASSGIDPDVEQAIYDRAMSRQDDEYAKALEEVENYFAAKGFDMPPGALAARINELNNQKFKATTDLNNDIIVQRSNLVQQNLQHIMNAGVQLEQFLRAFHTEVWNRELQKQQMIAEFRVKHYTLMVEKYNAEVMAYNTEAEVFKSRIQAELGRVEAFKALVESSRVQAEVQQQLVQVYLARLEGVKSLVEVYKTQMESAKIFSEVQVAKINAYSAGVDAYVARVNAYSAEWQGYQSKVQAQGIKVSSFGELAKVFQTRVGAWSSEVEGKINQARLQLEENQNKIQLYATDIQRYQQIANWNLGKVQSEVALEEVKTKVAATNVQGNAAQAETRASNEQRKLGEYELKLNGAVEEMKADLAGKVEEYKLHFEKLKAQAQVLTQISASALSAVSSNLNYGFSGSLSGNLGVSESYSNQRSKSASSSLQTSVSHNRSVQGSVSEQRADQTNYNEHHNYEHI